MYDFAGVVVLGRAAVVGVTVLVVLVDDEVTGAGVVVVAALVVLLVDDEVVGEDEGEGDELDEETVAACCAAW